MKFHHAIMVFHGSSKKCISVNALQTLRQNQLLGKIFIEKFKTPDSLVGPGYAIKDKVISHEQVFFAAGRDVARYVSTLSSS